MANIILELISEARISAINSLLSVAEHFTNLYYSSDIKCRIYVSSVASTTPNRAAIPSCDAGILGSLIIHYATIGIRPVPLPPYKGISVESLALALKGLHCSVKVDKGHGGCSIIGQVARQVDEVLARVDRLDLWDSMWGQDEATGKGLRKEGYRIQVSTSSGEDYEVEPCMGDSKWVGALDMVSIFRPYYIFLYLVLLTEIQ